jgi:hypothetical protein
MVTVVFPVARGGTASAKMNFVTKWPKILKADASNRLKFVRMGILTTSFYLLTNSIQRLAGVISIHSGKSPIATKTFGIASTAASCLLSREIQELLLPTAGKGIKRSAFRLINSDGRISRAFLGFGVFSFLEKKSFMTAIPSSVIALGVHARNIPFLERGSVLSTNKVANQKQRKLIQVLGSRLGCHQCGSKQFFKRNRNFIADHMPPTHFVEKLNAVWWRKAFNIKVRFRMDCRSATYLSHFRTIFLQVVQELWPQCQSCFRIQGTAVKMNRHILIHHHNLQIYHFAPAIAYLMSENERVQYCVKKIIDFCGRGESNLPTK